MSQKIKVIVLGGRNFPSCGTCINREFDPFRCQGCVNASNYEDADASDYLTVAELQASELDV